MLLMSKAYLIRVWRFFGNERDTGSVSEGSDVETSTFPEDAPLSADMGECSDAPGILSKRVSGGRESPGSRSTTEICVLTRAAPSAEVGIPDRMQQRMVPIDLHDALFADTAES